MEAKVSSLEKAIESLLKEKEKGILLVMKTVYWLCKEGIAISIATMLTFLELVNTPHIQELQVIVVKMQHRHLILLQMKCRRP